MYITFLDILFVHSCNVIKTSQDKRLSFTNGSKSFTVSSALTGKNSKATGTVKTVTLSSGSWSEGTATGYLILSFASGNFTNGESISDSSLGDANASGTLILETDSLGTPINSKSYAPYKCFFSTKETESNSVETIDTGKMLLFYDIVRLPDNAIVEKGDSISTSQPGFSELYEVQNVYYSYDPLSGKTDHVGAYLKAVTKHG